MTQIILSLMLISFVASQVVKNVYVINHRGYMTEIISEVVKEVERREWCNLKLKDVTQDINENVLNWHLAGTVTYKNGFVVSIQHVDILESSLNQVWTGSKENVSVEIRGQWRMIDVAMGFDVEANLNGSVHHYTGLIVHPLVTFDFSVFRHAYTHEMLAKVKGTQPKALNVISFLPADKLSDVLSVVYDPAVTSDAVSSWATEIFQPITMDVISNIVKFPGLCYDCPAT